MAPWLCCEQTCIRDFTVLLVHVLYVSDRSALQGSTEFARRLVERFFCKYTRVDIGQIANHTHKFSNLAASSRLEIVFEGYPRGFKAPNYKVYKYEYSQGLVVIFEVEVRCVRRYIPPGSDYDSLEIERTDFLPNYWRVTDQDRSTRIYEN